MTASAELQTHAIITARPDTGPILMVTARDRVSIRAGTTIEISGEAHAFDEDTEVHVYAGLAPGQNYGVYIGEDGEPFAALAKTSRPLNDGFFAGFHYAPWSCERVLPAPDIHHAIKKVGKARAGRLLDGIEHNAFPATGR